MSAKPLAEGQPARIRGRTAVALAVVVSFWGLILVDEMVVNISLAQIAEALRLSQTELGWVVNAYLLPFGGLLLLGGQGMATVALTDLSASLTAILTASNVLWAAVFARVAGIAMDRATVLRLLLGFAGITVVVLSAPDAAIGGSDELAVRAGLVEDLADRHPERHGDPPQGGDRRAGNVALDLREEALRHAGGSGHGTERHPPPTARLAQATPDRVLVLHAPDSRR